MDKVTYIRVIDGINDGATGYITEKYKDSCRACLWINMKPTYRILQDGIYRVIKPDRRCVD